MKGFCTVLLGQQLKIYTDHKNLTCKTFNTDRVLRWKLILEKYIPDMEYIPGVNNIAVDALSILPANMNQETAHESMYAMETMSKLSNIEELPYGMFPLSFKLIDRYQPKQPFLTETHKCAEYQKGFLGSLEYYRTCNLQE